MYVCVCNRITDSQILEAAEKGATTLECLSRQLQVATLCGRCAECACEILGTHVESDCSKPKPQAA